MLVKNCPNVILDDDKLDDVRYNYLVAVRDGFLLICRGVSFYVEPYRPYGFS